MYNLIDQLVCTECTHTSLKNFHNFTQYFRYNQNSYVLFSFINSLKFSAAIPPTNFNCLFYKLSLSSALENLGVRKINRNPPGADIDEITLEVFLKEA